VKPFALPARRGIGRLGAPVASVPLGAPVARDEAVVRWGQIKRAALPAPHGTRQERPLRPGATTAGRVGTANGFTRFPPLKRRGQRGSRRGQIRSHAQKVQAKAWSDFLLS
jgi:hypothetical protein